MGEPRRNLYYFPVRKHYCLEISPRRDARKEMLAMTQETIREAARYAYDVIKRICVEVGPGIPCSPQERARAMIIKEEMEKTVGENAVAVEAFTCAPHAFLGWLKGGVVLMSISLVCHYLATQQIGAAALILSVAAFAIAALILVITTVEFVYCREFVDFLLPKKPSLNVVGTIKPRENQEVKKILIFGGHHDSAYQFTWARYLKYGYYVSIAIILWGVLAVAVKTGIYLIGIALDLPGCVDFGSIGKMDLLIPIGPAGFFAFFFLGTGKNGGQVPGAADNLSGCMLSVAVGKILMRHTELIPDHTEIRLISFGCEEAGMRGSRRYVERHYDELKEKDAMFFNIETVTDTVVNIMKSDCNGLCKNSPEMVQSVVDAAEQAGVRYRVRSLPFGGAGSDAYPFSEAGVKAACILPIRYPQQLIRFYHQPSDNYDILTLEPFEVTLKLAVEWTRMRKKV